MDAVRAVILGVIEGLTEFLPVSSTGHMIIANPLLGVDPSLPKWRVFLIVSQLGAILAVIVYFWRDLWRQVVQSPATPLRDHLVAKLIVGVAPALVAGRLADEYLEKYLEEGPALVAAALIIGAIAMELIDRRFRRPGDMTIEQISLRQALLIGVAQCISIWPGVSRAAATIMGGMVVGLTPRVAAQFSFYLAIPTMLAAGGYRTLKYYGDLSADGVGVVLLGTAVAFLVALGVVATFLNYVQRYRFTPFAIYRVILGVAVLAYFAARARSA